MSTTATAPQKKNSIVKSAIYFATGTLASRVLGLMRDGLITSIFTTTISDAYFAAFRFPNLFRRIFGEGALSACFIPLYVEYKKKEDHKSLAQLTVGILTLLLVLQIPLCAVMIWSMDSLMPLWVSGDGFAAVPGKMELTIQMTKITFPFLLLVSMYAFLMALLNAHKQFVMSAVAPSLFNLTMIIACVYCYFTQWLSGVFVAWSVLVGGFVQFAILIPPVMRLKLGYDFNWSYIRSLPVRRTLNAFLPSVLGLGIVQIMGLINVNFASRLAEGSVTRVSIADRILELPLSLVAVSLGTVLLPTLSENASGVDSKKMNHELFKTLKIILFLCVPAAVGLWMTSELLTSVLFERRHFTSEDTQIVAGILQVYCFTLLAISLARIVSQAFYAHKNTFQPALASGLGLLVHWFLAPVMMDQYGIYGLAASTSIVSFLNISYLMGFYSWRYGSMHFLSLVGFFLKALLASAVIVGVCWGAEELIAPVGFSQKAVALGASVVLSAVGYFAVAALLRLEEAQMIFKKIQSKIKGQTHRGS